MCSVGRSAGWVGAGRRWLGGVAGGGCGGERHAEATGGEDRGPDLPRPCGGDDGARGPRRIGAVRSRSIARFDKAADNAVPASRCASMSETAVLNGAALAVSLLMSALADRRAEQVEEQVAHLRRLCHNIGRRKGRAVDARLRA